MTICCNLAYFLSFFIYICIFFNCCAYSYLLFFGFITTFGRVMVYSNCQNPRELQYYDREYMRSTYVHGQIGISLNGSYGGGLHGAGDVS